MSLKSVLTKQYKAAFARWPKDTLRPDMQLPDVLGRQLPARLAGKLPVGKAGAGDLQQLRQANALYSLLDDRYKMGNRLTGPLMAPRSNPTYYNDLIAELQDAPKRSFLGRIGKRLGGMFRLS